MKQINFRQNNPSMGEINILMRIIGKVIFIKTNNNQYSDKLLQQLSSKGATIIRGRGWIQIRLFPQETEVVKLGNYEIDFSKDSEEKVEEIISKFYMEKYIEAGFSII